MEVTFCYLLRLDGSGLRPRPPHATARPDLRALVRFFRGREVFGS